MHTDQLQKPKAWAVIDKRTVGIYNYTSDKVIVILEFLDVPLLSSVLIFKYENYTELEITFSKTSCADTKLENLERLCHLLKRLTGADSTQIKNSLTPYDTHNSILIQCNHYANNP